MTAVTFPNGNSYSDDGTTANDMRNGGFRTNLLPMIGDTITVAEDAIDAAAEAVPAAATASAAATTATTQAGIAVAAANTAAGIVQHVQPSEIAGIDPILDFAFRASTAVPSGVITGSSGKWVTNQAGVLVNVPAGTAPIDYDPTTSALRGLLVEESRTNLLTYSQAFDDAAWFKTRITVTPNAAVSPDGAATMDKISETVAAGQHSVARSGTISAGGTYTASVYVKPAERSGIWLQVSDPSFLSGFRAVVSDVTTETGTTVVFGTGTVAGYTVKRVGAGIYRVTVTGVVDGSTTTANVSVYLLNGGVSSYTGDGTSGLYLWGAQLEVGSFATSYIPTTSSTVTRSGDVNPVTPLSSIPGWNASEGTIYVEAQTALGGGTQTYAQYDDGTNNNRIAVYRDSSNVMRCIVVVSGATVVNLNLGTVANDMFFKVAFGWKANSFAASLNGAAAVTATSGAIPAGLTTHRIGHAVSGNYANAPIRRDTGFSRRLADATLPLMSA